MRWFMALVMTALLIWGVVGVSETWLQRQREMRNARSAWPTVEGTVTYSRTVIADDAEPDPDSMGVQVTVRFAYCVDGVNYAGSQEWWDIETPQSAGYGRGGPVTVYYDPTRPGRSAIRPEQDSHWWQLSMLSIPLLGLALGGTVILSWAAGRLLRWAVIVGAFIVGFLALYCVAVVSGIPFAVLFYGLPFAAAGAVWISSRVRRRLHRRSSVRVTMT
jgi:hypothetical protein